MKYKFLLSTAFVFTVGCMGHGYNQGHGNYNNNSHHRSDYSYQSREASSNINSDIKLMLEYMYDEERLAKDIYLALYSKYRINQLERIATNSETRHIDAVNRLAQRYGVTTSSQRAGVYSVSKIQDLYNQLYSKGVRSQRDALEVGCMVEVTDINDLQEHISTAQRAGANDIVDTFESLKRGSYNHYWAFDRGLKQMGVSDGCCSLGREYCILSILKMREEEEEVKVVAWGMGSR